jgi:hypothetical protein
LKTVLLAEKTGIGLASMLPLSVGLLGLPFDRVGRIGLGAIILSLTAYLVEFPSSVTFNYCRYLYPIVVPWCCWGIVRAAANARQATAGVMIVATAVATVAMIPHWWIDQSAAARELLATARQIDMRVPADAVMLVHDAGVISEFAHRRAVDLVGLKSPASVEAHAKWTRPSCGANRSAAVAAILRASGASYLIVDAAWNRTFRLREGLTADGFVLDLIWSVRPSYGYSIYRVVTPVP